MKLAGLEFQPVLFVKKARGNFVDMLRQLDFVFSSFEHFKLQTIMFGLIYLSDCFFQYASRDPPYILPRLSLFFVNLCQPHQPQLTCDRSHKPASGASPDQ